MDAELWKTWFALTFWLSAVGVPAAALLYSLVIFVWERLSEEGDE